MLTIQTLKSNLLALIELVLLPSFYFPSTAFAINYPLQPIQVAREQSQSPSVMDVSMLITLILLLLASWPAYSAERYCNLETPGLDLILINPKESPKDLPTRRLLREDPNHLDPLDKISFYSAPMTEGDCLLLNLKEARTLYVAPDQSIPPKRIETLIEKLIRLKQNFFISPRFEQKELVPIVYFNKKDHSKSFGYIEKSVLSLLKRDPNFEETKTRTILEYASSQKNQDLTLIYVICPSSRDEVCQLRIQHHGTWLKNDRTHQIFNIPVLARSNRKQAGSLRLKQGEDTPQGIYTVWASMFSEAPEFGGIPRIDIDALYPPINSYPYELNSYVLSHLVPAESLNDYWVNEWPLAFRLNRSYLRLHSDSLHNSSKTSSNPSMSNASSNSTIYQTPQTHLSFALTQGCINVAGEMTNLIQTLQSLKVLDNSPPDQDTLNLNWKVSPALGKTFLILKDE